MKKILTAHIILILILIAQNVLSLAIGITGIKLSTASAMLLSQLTILLPFIIYCIVKKQNPLKVIRFKKIPFTSAILCVVIAMCSYPVVMCLNLLSMLFVENAMANVMTDILSKGLIFSILFMAVLPAIMEETIFRGMVYNTYSKRRPLLGVFLSAFLFGLMHMNFNQMPYAFFLGIVMALLMEACDSVVAPMIFHFTLNGSSTLISFLTMGTMESTEMTQTGDFKSTFMESYQASMTEVGIEFSQAEFNTMYPLLMTFVVVVYAVIALAALAGVLALIYAVFRMNNRRPSEVFKADHGDTAYLENKKGIMKRNRVIDFPVLLFMGYCIVMCVLSAVG